MKSPGWGDLSQIQSGSRLDVLSRDPNGVKIPKRSKQ